MAQFLIISSRLVQALSKPSSWYSELSLVWTTRETPPKTITWRRSEKNTHHNRWKDKTKIVKNKWIAKNKCNVHTYIAHKLCSTLTCVNPRWKNKRSNYCNRFTSTYGNRDILQKGVNSPETNKETVKQQAVWKKIIHPVTQLHVHVPVYTVYHTSML